MQGSRGSFNVSEQFVVLAHVMVALLVHALPPLHVFALHDHNPNHLWDTFGNACCALSTA